MTRSEKAAAIEELKSKLAEAQFFYLTDSSGLTVADVNELRGKCFESDIEMRVVKNTLAQKAMESLAEEKRFEGLYEFLKGPTAILFTSTSNAPAKVIKSFREKNEKPILKAAYIDSDIYVGDDQVDVLGALKSKDELVAEVLALLQSPMKNVVSALKSGGSTLSGLVKALEERAANQ